MNDNTYRQRSSRHYYHSWYIILLVDGRCIYILHCTYPPATDFSRFTYICKLLQVTSFVVVIILVGYFFEFLLILLLFFPFLLSRPFFD